MKSLKLINVGPFVPFFGFELLAAVTGRSRQRGYRRCNDHKGASPGESPHDPQGRPRYVGHLARVLGWGFWVLGFGFWVCKACFVHAGSDNFKVPVAPSSLQTSRRQGVRPEPKRY